VLLIDGESSLPRPRPLSAEAGPNSSKLLAATPTVMAAARRSPLLARPVRVVVFVVTAVFMNCSSVGVSVRSHATYLRGA
jgi:hypothetical protein